ncbi:MAG: transglycosylase SLT domain-containing protein [Coxiellaceae bacterium]|nr:transglycosylase SLT domain-containing protein [Coxiellaceae bacterium]
MLILGSADRKIQSMRYMTRTTMLFSTLMLGWINIPAQAGLLSENQSMWPVLSQHFTFSSETEKTDVRRQISIDLQNPKYIQRLTRNARPYLYYVFQETEKKHMPAELALLPMIESDYTPKGTSDVGAAGLWQLMPDTANGYGIKMNSFYDGRRSTTVSTKAALSFLSYLYDMFNHNWLLAIAAYNAGPGTVLNAIHYNQAHGRPTNFWSLPLPKETQAYVPKLLALAAIIQHPTTYGIHLSPVPNAPVSSPVMITKQMPLEKIASYTHTSITTVKKLNPALKSSLTPPHQTIAVMIPTGQKEQFVSQLKAQKKIEDAVIAKKLGHYTVQHGDSLSTIAKRFNTTVAALKEINQIHSGLIKFHQALLVPKLIASIKKPHTTTVAVKSTPHHATKTVAAGIHYTVKHGDNLRVLAKRYHTSIVALMHKNHMKHSALQIGQHIIV